jgi:hypothetical protein
MNRLRVAAVSTILLASDLSHRLARWAYLVNHSVLSLPLPNLCPNYDDFFLRYPDRLVTPGTEVNAQFETSNDKTAFGARALVRVTLRFTGGNSAKSIDP